MNKTTLIITSIANDDNEVLQLYAQKATKHNFNFIVVGDVKSPADFNIEGCRFLSIENQNALPFSLCKNLPVQHYSRKNVGYLTAMQNGANIIVETDDDNLPLPDFWAERKADRNAYFLHDTGWTNIYRYFTDDNVWPRGFSLQHVHNTTPQKPAKMQTLHCPVQQGLADKNPDVDAIYRLIFEHYITFNKANNIALGKNSFCPFNSQNTTWFSEAFPLLYLPSYCSFRMTDIWRSFVAQRVAWTCGWQILFHASTVYQQRNNHNLLHDFSDEVVGYEKNNSIYEEFIKLNLKLGVEHIGENMITCYKKLVEMNIVDSKELNLLNCWLNDIENIYK